MKIILINPPLNPPIRSRFIPLGLSYISATLKKAGYQVKCIDGCNMSWGLLEKKIIDFNPDLAGIVCWTFTRSQVWKTAKIIKKILPKTKIIIGGQHATFLPEQTMEAADADFLVLGEGEITIVELIDSIGNNKDFSKVKGIAYRDKNKIVITPQRPFIPNLDIIPFPDYSDFNLDNYFGLTGAGLGRRAAGIITSRGCPYDCLYCSSKEYWTKKWRYRSTENILSEIEYLYFDLEVRALTFYDDNFTISKERAIRVCQGIIERKLDLKWISIASVRSVDKEILMWMKRAGCYELQYGVESGSPKILENINKGQTIEQIKNAFKWTKDAGMNAIAYLFVGAPGETAETVDETISLMREISPNQEPNSGILWILPGTKIYQISKEQGIISDDTWVKKNDEFIYYTGEYSVDELKYLQMRLNKGLARNKSIYALLIYLARSKLKKIKIMHRMVIHFRKLRNTGIQEK